MASQRLRVLCLALAFIGLAVFAASALLPSHYHAASAQDPCAICQLGHVVASEVPPVSTEWPPIEESDEFAYASLEIPLERAAVNAPSRAPPSA